MQPSVIGPLTELMVNNKVQVYTEAIQYIENTDFLVDDHFSDLLYAVFSVNQDIPQAALADSAGYTATSVGRWVRGVSTPHPAARDRIVSKVKELVVARKEQLESALEAYAAAA